MDVDKLENDGVASVSSEERGKLETRRPAMLWRVKRYNYNRWDNMSRSAVETSGSLRSSEAGWVAPQHCSQMFANTINKQPAAKWYIKKYLSILHRNVVITLDVDFNNILKSQIVLRVVTSFFRSCQKWSVFWNFCVVSCRGEWYWNKKDQTPLCSIISLSISHYKVYFRQTALLSNCWLFSIFEQKSAFQANYFHQVFFFLTLPQRHDTTSQHSISLWSCW